MHTKSLRELPAMTYETSKCQKKKKKKKKKKWVSYTDLLIFSQFHRHTLKNQTMLFPTTLISASEKIGVGLEKTSC